MMKIKAGSSKKLFAPVIILRVLFIDNKYTNRTRLFRRVSLMAAVLFAEEISYGRDGLFKGYATKTNNLLLNFYNIHSTVK